MALPQIIVEIAFASNPLDPPVWTNVSAFVRACAIRRGRQRDLDRVEAGTATVTLDNRDRRFDPTNSASPYAPNIVPMRRLRISAVWQTVTYRLFTGFIEAWQQRWPEGRDAVVEVSCADAFKFLNLYQVSTLSPFDGRLEDSGVRINRLLTAIDWPAADTFIDPGVSMLQAGQIGGVSVLQHLQTVVETETGFLFVAGNGQIVFRNRHARIRPSPTAPPVFGDGPGELPYAELVIDATDDQLWNAVTVARVNGTTPGQATDATSQTRYGQRTLSKSSLLQTTDAECQAAAEYLVARYASPQLVLRTMTLEPAMADALWPATLGRELGDRVIVRRRPPGGGTAIEQTSFVEGISWDIAPGTWRTTWQLSQADLNTYWMLAGTDTDQYAPFSVLEQTTRLAY
jgi:hypothetical protein